MQEFNLFECCQLQRITNTVAQLPFCCGDEALERFYHQEAVLYADAFFTVSNDSVKTSFIPKSSTNRVQRKIPGQKHLRTYPAVMIGRLGVAKEYQGSSYHIGQQVINYLKSWFVEEDNKTGCRFMVVDAYNNDRTLNFYIRNGFKFLYSNEEQERIELQIDQNEKLLTRHMFLDLLNTFILE